jgi:hypothetical protein
MLTRQNNDSQGATAEKIARTKWARALCLAFALFASINTLRAENGARWETMKPGQIMAVDEKTLDQAFGMLMDDDREAVVRLMMANRVRLSEGTEKVVLEKTNGWLAATKIAVRMKGSTKTWWVMVDATVEP